MFSALCYTNQSEMKNLQKRVLVLQHHRCENLGTIADALQRARIEARYIHSADGEPMPKELGEAAGLIVMGGPQSVYEDDKFPYLREETRLIEDALRRERPVLGTCLGSQLLAATLGAKVYPGRTQEIGWHRLTLATGGACVSACGATDPLFAGAPKSFTGFHWHGDVFDLPRGATQLASSSLTVNQAFRYGKKTYALLFHMEVTLPQIRTMVETFAGELHTAGLNGAAIKLNANLHLPMLHKIGSVFYQRWASLLQ